MDSATREEVTVTVEARDSSGRRIVYQGKHMPGEEIAAGKVRITTDTTVRILINGELRDVREYSP
jgi:hypothetical protein